MTRSDFFKSITGAIAAAGVTLPKEAQAVEVQEVPKGKLYVIEVDAYLTDESQASVRRQLEPFEREFGCKFLVLDRRATLRNPDSHEVHIHVNPPRDMDGFVKQLRNHLQAGSPAFKTYRHPDAGPTVGRIES